jgi:hypothetical protein
MPAHVDFHPLWTRVDHESLRVKLSSKRSSPELVEQIPLGPPEGVKKFRCSGSSVAKVMFFYELSNCVSHEQF